MKNGKKMNTDGQNKKSFCQKIEPWIVKNEFNLDRTKNIFCLNGDCAFAATMLFNANENWIVIRGTFEYKKADNNCYAKAATKLYIPSTLNTDYILWHTQLIVWAAKYYFMA